jgi:hypothetical protein
MSEIRGGLYRRLAVGTILLGSLLRLRQFVDARPLWLDEAMLSLNILTRSFVGLLRPLDQDQTAPIAFLWMQKAAVLIGGPHELALRTVPLLAGIGFLVLFWRLSERLLEPGAVLVGLVLASLSPLLIVYSNEAKPYGVDAFLSCAILLLALRLLDDPGNGRRWWALGAAGTFVAVASAPAMFVLAATLAALAIPSRVRTQPAAWPRLIAMGTVWSLAFGAVYLLVYRPAAESPYMQRYWLPNFIGPIDGGALGRMQRAMGKVLELFFMAEGGIWRDHAAILFLLPLALGGVWMLRQRGAAIGALVVMPLVAVVGASVLKQYPIAARLLLFGAAPILLLVSAGIADLADRFFRFVPGPWLAMAGCATALLPGLNAVRGLVAPEHKDDLAPLIVELEAGHSRGAAVYVSARAVPAWLFYTTDWRHAPDTARVRMLGDLVSSEGRAFRHAPTRDHPIEAEGDDLAYQYRDWTELIGIPTGQGPNAQGIGTDLPDAGWARNEARRLKAAGREDNWIVMASFAGPVPGTLRHAVEREGGRITLWDQREGALVARVRF